MARFLQIHALTAYPPSNLNRDDLGRPKTAHLGGKTRLRISSQSLKRAWRTSDTFAEVLDGAIGTRTRTLGLEISDRLTDAGVEKKDALDWTERIIASLAKVDKAEREKERIVTGQLVHIAPSEREAMLGLADKLAKEKRAPTDEELSLLQERPRAADIAAFGRMLAEQVTYNVEAAVQVAHAITVHEVAVEDDFFTAVDDLNAAREDREDAGSAHMGTVEFGAGTFYLYVCVDRELLLDNLQGDEALAKKTVEALIRTLATVAPRGKQATFASRAYASYILAERGDQQPRSLTVAFLEPVGAADQVGRAIEVLQATLQRMDKVYGAPVDAPYEMNVYTGEGTLEELIEFATAGSK